MIAARGAASNAQAGQENAAAGHEAVTKERDFASNKRVEAKGLLEKMVRNWQYLAKKRKVIEGRQRQEDFSWTFSIVSVQHLIPLLNRNAGSDRENQYNA
jgi:hypothetical protein